jgi:hypothetical protein
MFTNFIPYLFHLLSLNSQFFFDDLCRVQSSWFIFDEQLKEEIRISIEKLLLPAYENFIGRFHNIADVGKHAKNTLSMKQRRLKQDSMICFREAVDQLVAENEVKTVCFCVYVFIV